MKIFIPSRGRPDSICTHRLFPDEDYYIVLHNDEERMAYIAYSNHTGIDKSKIVVSNLRPGIGMTRNWILENLTDPGEWYMMMDDNVRAITAIKTSMAVIPREVAKKVCRKHAIPWSEFVGMRQECVERAMADGANLIGFATTDNPMLRLVKYRNVGFVIGQMIVACNVGLRYDQNMIVKEDYEFTAKHLQKYGKVLINNHIWPRKSHGRPGGCGRLAQREDSLVSASNLLMLRYPGLFRYNLKRNERAAEILLRFNKVEQIEKWRKLNETEVHAPVVGQQGSGEESMGVRC